VGAPHGAASTLSWGSCTYHIIAGANMEYIQRLSGVAIGTIIPGHMQQLLRAYIPNDRYAALAAGHELPDRARGAALFADISGFTPLTAAFAREYGFFRGAEEMTDNMKRIYEALVTEAHRFGGSVVSFCGDAIICWIG